MPASSLREEAQATVSNKPGHRGDHEVSRKTIARGMPGDFRCDRGDYARVLFSLHARVRARRASGNLARHAHACLGHPRLSSWRKPWSAGTSPAMTADGLEPGY